MNHKTSELEGALLDAAVAKAAGYPYLIREVRSEDLRCRYDDCLINTGPVDLNRRVTDHVFYSPSREWKDGGPIIEREHIALEWEYLGENSGCWSAGVGDTEKPGHEGWQFGPTLLIAAMRMFVYSRLGPEITLP